MPGLKWPHQPKPRPVERIVDDQVKLWSFKQEGHKDIEAQDGMGSALSRQLGIPEGARRQKAADRLGFSFWGEAITTELTRLMVAGEKSVAYLNEGMNVAANDLPGNTACDGPSRRSARRRRARDQ
jgi:hypothetical protein